MKHKTAIATAASVTGVLVASAAALGANVGILRSADESFGQLSASTTVPSSTSAVAAEERLYRIPDVADITVGSDGTSVWIVAVEPASGWAQRTSDSDGSAEVELFSGSDRLEFEAFLQGGEIRTTLERESTDDGGRSGDVSGGTTTTTAGGTAPAQSPIGSQYDDEYEDDDEYDEYDDEDDDDHEHDGRDDDD